MAPRTRKEPHEGQGDSPEQGETIIVPDLPQGSAETVVSRETALIWSRMDNLSDQIHSRIDALVLESAEHRRMIEPLILPLLRIQPEPGSEHAKVLRRRALDEMEFALKRLTSPDPRPQDDDSPQVLQDAINEVIALRQAMQDLMQASANVYQRGLTTIRDMTSR